jgi:uncharacterized membrane protein YvbJ
MARKSRAQRPSFACPHCGADVAQGAAACRECGSDASTGWQDQEEIDYQSLDLPQGYADEGHPGARLPSRPRLWVVVVAIVLVLGLLWLAVVR